MVCPAGPKSLRSPSEWGSKGKDQAPRVVGLQLLVLGRSSQSPELQQGLIFAEDTNKSFFIPGEQVIGILSLLLTNVKRKSQPLQAGGEAMGTC